MGISWANLGNLDSRNYICGYCGRDIASNKGYSGSYSRNIGRVTHTEKTFIYICHHCGGSTFFDHTRQVPGPILGRKVDGLPEDIDSLYYEARNCITVKAFTASVLCCRKLLMNIAVEKGAKEGKKFIEYVEFLSDQGFVPPDGKSWVDHIRQKGNEATHEIAIMDPETAIELLKFMELLLIFTFELPAIMKSKANS